MVYVTLAICRQELFPFIHHEMTGAESAADYFYETDGMAQLEKVLSFVQHDGYYPSLPEKASYLLCSIAGSQYFSNGNKRLSITVLLKFLTLNQVGIKTMGHDGFRLLLESTFPDFCWEENLSIIDPHAHFLYNLAIVIGDRTQWGNVDFSIVKERVALLFQFLYA